MNNKTADQTAHMHSLICIFVVRIWHDTAHIEKEYGKSRCMQESVELQLSGHNFFLSGIMQLCEFYLSTKLYLDCFMQLSESPIIFHKPEDHWSSIAHLSAEDTYMFKSAVIEENKFKI